MASFIDYARGRRIPKSKGIGAAALLLAGVANLGGVIWLVGIERHRAGHHFPETLSFAGFIVGFIAALTAVVMLIIAISLKNLGRAGKFSVLGLAIYCVLFEIAWHRFLPHF